MGIKRIGTSVYFGKRSGRIIGHTILKRLSAADNPQPFYIVELSAESAGYLEPLKGENEHDCFISLMLIRVGNENDD